MDVIKLTQALSSVQSPDNILLVSMAKLQQKKKVEVNHLNSIYYG